MNKGLILVTGSEGLVGSRFIELYPQKEVLHTPRQIEFDITDKSQVKAIIKSFDFKAVIHFAAYTDVGGAEKQCDKKKELCWQVNVEGTRNLVEAVAPFKDKIHFIQISTDMVFTGDKSDPGPYKENHKPETDSSKITWYGFTKADAERIVKEKLGSDATILRLIYPVRARFEMKLDYLSKPLALYDEGKLYPLFNDQQISIAFVDEVCFTLEKIIDGHATGVFHASSSDTTTPYELISYMLERARGVKNAANSISLEKFLKGSGSSKVRYPKYGGLSVDMTEKKLGIKFSSWRAIVDKLISQGLGR